MASSSSQISQNLVQEFWTECSSNSRQWLRCEVESLLDPLFDDLFTRLGEQFVHFMEQRKLTTPPPIFEHENSGFNGIVDVDSSTLMISKPDATKTNGSDRNSVDQLENLDEPRVLIKEEIEILSNNQDSLNMNQFPQIENQELDNNVDMGDAEYDADCDCDECLNGGIDLKEESSDNLEVENVDQSESMHQWNKDTSVVEVNDFKGTSSTRQPKGPRKYSHFNVNVFKTISLNCTQENCAFISATKLDLDRHLIQEHGVRKFQCLIRNCNASFDSSHVFGQHLRETHHSITRWPCQHCGSHSGSYSLLNVHTARFHHLGRFQCSFQKCSFIADRKSSIYSHYSKQHKPDFSCQYDGCSYRAKSLPDMNAHKMLHHNKPFRCRWVGCGYSDATREATTYHVQTVHLANVWAMPEGSRTLAYGQAQDYVEVIK